MARYANVKLDAGIVLGLMTAYGPLHTPNDGCAFVLLRDGQACEPGWSATLVQMPLPENEVASDWVFSARQPIVSKVRFTFFLWKPDEWVAALARKDSDPKLAFYLGMLNSPDVEVIDLSLPEVQAAIEYILDALSPDIVAEDQKAARLAQILAG